MVLLVIDVQKQITNGELYAYRRFVACVQALLPQARENGVEVLYVRHDDGPASELPPGKEGFEIDGRVAPAPGEKIFDKTVNSAFQGTGLLEYLQSKREREVLVAGLQTDYCIDAAVKCGFEHGLRMIVPQGANTTVDNDFLTGEQSVRYYNEMMWSGRYAECISLEETLNRMRG